VTVTEPDPPPAVVQAPPSAAPVYTPPVPVAPAVVSVPVPSIAAVSLVTTNAPIDAAVPTPVPVVGNHSATGLTYFAGVDPAPAVAGDRVSVPVSEIATAGETSPFGTPFTAAWLSAPLGLTTA